MKRLLSLSHKILSLCLCAVILFGMIACAPVSSSSDTPVPKKSRDVVVLFTNDVHGGIDDNIGYAGLAAYKKAMSEKYRYVVLADCGDFSQGSYECAVSRGEYVVDIMNAVGYDFAIFGNHEFDYGMEQLKKNVCRSDAQFLCANLTYTGEGEDWIAEETKPYVIEKYGKLKVAFIGVSTPWSVSTSTPLHFMENGEFVYDFCGEDADAFYANTQKYVDECRDRGADHVIVLSHLGTDLEADTPFTSIELIENTTGIDAVLDAHSHTETSCQICQNRDGNDVLLSSTGTKLSKIGQLVISDEGTVTVGYVDTYTEKDEEVAEMIDSVLGEFDGLMNRVIAHTDVSLSCSDADGIRMIRSRELALGDFVADAFRLLTGADIGICNGGGIRADLKAGDITYRDIIAVNPYGNTLCVVKVTGAEIADMLEYFYRYVQSDYKKDGKAWGEDGSFQQVSGLKFTVDTSIESSAEADAADAFTGISGARRVSDIKVLQGGEYVPLDPEATYTLASHNYLIKNGGSGMLYFLADHELVLDEAIADYQALIDYFAMLGGDLSQYSTTDGRITILP